ncbi:amidohydrolase family protein [Phenylobacterium sp. LjRoot219]|uniref:amidohydrolase family protein n=1 Tax=Phenylobacterium sp. LjRoot219 TaxID=3342283 RepID=UPI003ECD01C0
MARVGIISVDGHVKAPWARYREYLDPQWRGRYDDWVKPFERTPDFVHAAHGEEAQWDPQRRVAALEAQGVVAEVVFPNGATPFSDGERDAEAIRAGHRAYNRWLADICSQVPGRMFAQALVHFGDVDAAVAEIHAAKKNGFVGILMPPLVPEAPGSRYFFDPALDPIWAACVETGLPISQHGGVGAPHYRPSGLAAFLVLATEHSFFSGRSLWQLILGGVYDRFPDLKVAYVETEAWWLRPVMDLLDRRDLVGDDWAAAAGRGGQTRPYRRRPSDYLRTNIYMGVSPFPYPQGVAAAFDDGQERELVATGNAMIGVDYPHPETALSWLRAAVDQFTGLPNITEAGARKVIYGNAAQLYGIDLAPLRPAG